MYIVKALNKRHCICPCMLLAGIQSLQDHSNQINLSMSTNLHLRFHFFNCFSLKSRIDVICLFIIHKLTHYILNKTLNNVVLCSYTFSKLLVTPIYNVPFRLLAKIYTKYLLNISHSPVKFRTSGFPLKACGNEALFLCYLLIAFIYLRYMPLHGDNIHPSTAINGRFLYLLL